MNRAETLEITKFLKILTAVVIFFGIVYIFTSKVVEKKQENTNETTQYNEIIGSTILKQNEKEYYVLMYKSNGELKQYYDDLQDKYIDSDKNPKLYFVDLNNILNKDFIANEKTNFKINEIIDLKVNDGTLLIIKSNKIFDYKINYKDIKNTLGL